MPDPPAVLTTCTAVVADHLAAEDRRRARRDATQAHRDAKAQQGARMWSRRRQDPPGFIEGKRAAAARAGGRCEAGRPRLHWPPRAHPPPADGSAAAPTTPRCCWRCAGRVTTGSTPTRPRRGGRVDGVPTRGGLMAPKPKPWLRLYTEVTRDRKLRREKPETRWLWIAVLCLARSSPQPGRLMLSDGSPVDVEDLADEAAITLAAARRGVARFRSTGCSRSTSATACCA